MKHIVLLISVILTINNCSSQNKTKDEYLLKRQLMVKEQIKDRDVNNRDVLNALLKVERHLFVPAAMRNHAYEDNPLPIGFGQTISQPYIVAYMTDILNLNKEMRVLEVGTGSGYQAAVLAELSKEVYSIEIVDSLAIQSEKLLKKLGYQNIKIKIGNGYDGWVDFAPYNAIIVTCAPINIPKNLLEQLAEGGKMIIPAGEEDSQVLYLIEKENGKISKTQKLYVRFVPMVNY